MSGAENGAERAENRVDRSGALSGRGKKNDGAGAECGVRSGRSRSGNGTGSGLNRQLTARSSLTIH